MHLRPEYDARLAGRGGWLILLYCFLLLAALANLRAGFAGVMAGAGLDPVSLALAPALLVALIALLCRVRWSYYLLLLTGVVALLRLAAGLLAEPALAFATDWKFDLPLVAEIALTLIALLYLVRSRRVYSFLLASSSSASSE